MQHLRRAFGFNPKPKTEVAGIKETGQLQKGIIYHAKGRLHQTPAFEHELICGRTAAIADATQIDNAGNSTVVAAILRAEQRQHFRTSADLLFNKPANFAIDFTVKPAIGDRVVLLRRTIRIVVPGMDDDGIARMVCKFLVATATGLQYDSLPREFKDINSLFLLTKNWYPTTQFWHSTILYGYVQIVFRNGYPGDRRM